MRCDFEFAMLQLMDDVNKIALESYTSGLNKYIEIILFISACLVAIASAITAISGRKGSVMNNSAVHLFLISSFPVTCSYF